jgi:hypothetical protein
LLMPRICGLTPSPRGDMRIAMLARRDGKKPGTQYVPLVRGVAAFVT